MVFDKAAYMREYRKRAIVKERHAKRMERYRILSTVKERHAIRMKKYRKQATVKERHAIRMKKYRKVPAVKIRQHLRTRIWVAFVRYANGKRYSHRCEMDVRAIAKHLGPMPQDGKVYHIDHIIPLSAFDLTDSAQVKKAFAPENHQWLEGCVNLKKNALWRDGDGNLRWGKRILKV